uniref:Uncharacterized protein n=1 Tax=viral metagenome TaxID=1070528 RepID=A0A6H1ZG55_9ZZZZ
MEDEQTNVQAENVPGEGTPSTEAQKPLDETRLQQILSEHSETLKRQLQSEKDKAIAEVRKEAERRIRMAEDRTSAIKSTLAGYDPDSGKDLGQTVRMAELEAQERSRLSYAQQEEQRRLQEQAYGSFKSQVAQYATDVGLDPQKLDWGDDSEQLLDKQSRLLKQIGTQQKESQKRAQDELKKQQADFESKIREELGLDKVPRGSGTALDAGTASLKEITEALKTPTKMTKEQRKKYLESFQ